MNRPESRNGEEREYPHWNRVYAAVIVFATALIIGLWLFSRLFQ